MKHAQRLVACAMSLFVVAGCSQNYSPKPVEEALKERGLTATPASPGKGRGAENIAAPEYGVEADPLNLPGLKARLPAGWERRPPSSSMRVAEFVLKAKAGGSEDEASLAIFKGPMGSVNDNVDRWTGQFADVESSERWEVPVDGGREQVTVVDVSGTFTGSMGQDPGRQVGYRLLGAIVGQGSYYIKLLGPGRTVGEWKVSFEEFVSSISTG